MAGFVIQLSTISLISPSTPCCTLKFLAKFLRNSSEDTPGFGNFSFLSACLITEPSILNSGVDGVGNFFTNLIENEELEENILDKKGVIEIEESYDY